MLADTVEAAVRALPDPTPKNIEAAIERLIRGKLEDGQLSESPLTLKDIDKISESFAQSLNGAFHERIEYPNVAIPSAAQTSLPTPSPVKPEAPAEEKKEEETTEAQKTQTEEATEEVAENREEETVQENEETQPEAETQEEKTHED